MLSSHYLQILNLFFVDWIASYPLKNLCTKYFHLPVYHLGPTPLEHCVIHSPLSFIVPRTGKI